MNKMKSRENAHLSEFVFYNIKYNLTLNIIHLYECDTNISVNIC